MTMQQTYETVTDGFHWPDKAVVRELNDAFNYTCGDRCVLAMEGLRRLDFYGLEMLVLMSDVAQAKGVTLTIRRPQSQVKELLSLTEVDRFIPIEI
ncbi:MAG: STAS domain-containing protein [Alphaproteobacteria bacterium]|nr:STAS domain-containing protein [Alphaproteobacteria bacterium]